MRAENGPTHMSRPEMYRTGSRKKYRRLRRVMMPAANVPRLRLDKDFAGRSRRRQLEIPECSRGDGGGLGELLLPPPPEASVSWPFPLWAWVLDFMARLVTYREREREREL